MPFELAKMSAEALERLPRTQTVFFYAVGPLEDHGPHLPLGLDLAEATELCRLAALELESKMPGWVGVIMPAAPLGIEGNTTALAITVRPHVLRDWLVDATRSLARQGFRHFVCWTGHLGPRQLTAIEEAGTLISRTGPLGRIAQLLTRSAPVTLVSASSALVSIEDMKASPFTPDPAEHGGQRDASVARALGIPVAASASARTKEGSHWGRILSRMRKQLSGHWGDPTQASAAAGQQTLQSVLGTVFPKLQATWQGANPNHLFRSWYSILPPNKSFFKAWVLAFLFFMLMTFWIYINFQSLISQ